MLLLQTEQPFHDVTTCRWDGEGSEERWTYLMETSLHSCMRIHHLTRQCAELARAAMHLGMRRKSTGSWCALRGLGQDPQPYMKLRGSLREPRRISFSNVHGRPSGIRPRRMSRQSSPLPRERPGISFRTTCGDPSEIIRSKQRNFGACYCSPWASVLS
jgi:hypothetical protein